MPQIIIHQRCVRQFTLPVHVSDSSIVGFFVGDLFINDTKATCNANESYPEWWILQIQAFTFNRVNVPFFHSPCFETYTYLKCSQNVILRFCEKLHVKMLNDPGLNVFKIFLLETSRYVFFQNLLFSSHAVHNLRTISTSNFILILLKEQWNNYWLRSMPAQSWNIICCKKSNFGKKLFSFPWKRWNTVKQCAFSFVCNYLLSLSSFYMLYVLEKIKQVSGF